MSSSATSASKPPIARPALIVGVTTGVYGIAFGALAEAAGASALQALVLSTLVFTGGSQFVAVGVVSTGGSVGTALSAAWLLGVRNAFYGLRIAPLVRRHGAGRRALAAHLTIDESTAMAVLQDEPADAERAFWLTGLAVFGCWNLGTLVGALGASALGSPETFGLDAAAPAAFLAFLAPQLTTGTARWVCLASGLLCAVAVPITRPGVPVLLAALPAVLVALRRPDRAVDASS